MKYILVNVGCIECGASSDIVGVFDNKAHAEALAALCNKEYARRERGQNSFEVFPMPKLNVINPKYPALLTVPQERS